MYDPPHLSESDSVGFSTLSLARIAFDRLPGFAGPIPSAALDKAYLVSHGVLCNDFLELSILDF